MPFPEGMERPGRPKGLKNKQTLEQRKFAEDVCYGLDGKGRDAFVEHVRSQLFSGALPPGVVAIIFYWLLGKPVERIEVKELPADYSQLTPDQLRDRALAIAARPIEQPVIDVESSGADDAVH